MERLSEREKERIRELVAEGSPAWVIHQEISRSRWAIRRYINSLERPPKREPKRSPLRLSQDSSKSHADTRVYRVVHEVFRLTTTRFADATEKLKPSALQHMIGPHWDFYATVLHHHHHVEDESLFPALLAVRPDLHELIKALEDDHQQLIPAIDAVGSAIRAFEQQPDGVHQEAMHDGVLAVREAFFPHLDIEDEQILPAIAESILV